MIAARRGRKTTPVSPEKIPTISAEPAQGAHLGEGAGDAEGGRQPDGERPLDREVEGARQRRQQVAQDLAPVRPQVPAGHGGRAPGPGERRAQPGGRGGSATPSQATELAGGHHDAGEQEAQQRARRPRRGTTVCSGRAGAAPAPGPRSWIWNQTQPGCRPPPAAISRQPNPLAAAASGEGDRRTPPRPAGTPRGAATARRRSSGRRLPLLACARWKKWSRDVVLPRSERKVKKVTTENARV